jgi:glycosyltransferase involved in cell wall biosynthesis
MIATIVDVARSEGLRSVAVRAAERLSEAWEWRWKRLRGAVAPRPRPSLVNVLAIPPSPRHGGVAVQWNARLEEERRLRPVALFDHCTLEIGSRAWPVESIEAIGARTLIVEGAFGDLRTLPGEGAERICVIHDFSLLSRNPHELDVDAQRCANAERWLGRARAAIFPSAFLRDAYRAVIPRFEAYVIEPGIADVAVRASPVRSRVAFVGSVKKHKGGALIPEIVRATRGADCIAEWHVFGGGDFDLLRAVRGTTTVHGYYRAGSLPRLLARHGIGLAVLPSIVPESFSLTLSECWSAGVPVVAFDHGAIAERIRGHGGGFLVPRDAGAEGLAECVRAWLRGATATIPPRVPAARDTAAAHVALYRELEVL